MKNKLEQLKRDFLELVEKVTDRQNLEHLQTEFLGRKGKLNEVMKEMAELAVEERKLVGKLANEVKEAIEQAFGSQEQKINQSEVMGQSQREWIDISEPGIFPSEGHLHPVTQAIEEITDIFSRIGFTAVRVPEIDWDYYAFESLNMPKDHPARDDWETFFVDAPEGHGEKEGKLLLTPHTSNSQVRTMEKQKPPIQRFFGVSGENCGGIEWFVAEPNCSIPRC